MEVKDVRNCNRTSARSQKHLGRNQTVSCVLPILKATAGAVNMHVHVDVTNDQPLFPHELKKIRYM